jgi:FlaA1/EpsC-like NDP-sugar epimerase
MYKNKYHETSLSKISVLVTGGAGFIGSNKTNHRYLHQ